MPTIRNVLRVLAAASIPAAVMVARSRRDHDLSPVASLGVVCSVPLAAYAALPAGRVRGAGIWAAQMWAYKIAFEVPYDRPERLRARLRIDEPIRFDTRIGLGTPPGRRLQRALRRPPGLTALDRAVTAVYGAWLIEPHAAMAWLLWRHPERFASAAARVGATIDLTLIGYFAVPTTPPWWASEREGRLGHDVRRVVDEVRKDLRGEPRPGSDHNSGVNPWAAMPSDHFASALAVAAVLAEANPRAGVAGGAYAGLLGLTLVYAASTMSPTYSPAPRSRPSGPGAAS